MFAFDIWAIDTIKIELKNGICFSTPTEQLLCPN